ncbi:hypothetical protein Ahy_B01g056696 [Arachis hypogaea]|uniref:FAR1 domain-containing protein n=1 Tax=Arachis hypogaea TaxID=3818 RepID=A0A445AZB5_ARAHY|nr:hypothetical protein Ahy_B01g056696 [Arachis hypogaea]
MLHIHAITLTKSSKQFFIHTRPSSHLNESDLDHSSESNQADESRCVVDEQFILKTGMTFMTLEEAGKFYKNYSKLASFSTKIRNMTRKGEEIKN